MYQGFMHLETETRAAELHWSFLFLVNLAPLVGLPRKAFPAKQAKVDTGPSVFLCLRKQRSKIRKASPRALFDWKNWIEQLNLLLKWVLNEMWRRLSVLSSKCRQVATLNLSAVQRQANSKPFPDCMFRKLPVCLNFFFPNTFQELKPFPCHVPLVWYMGTSTPKYYL